MLSRRSKITMSLVFVFKKKTCSSERDIKKVFGRINSERPDKCKAIGNCSDKTFSVVYFNIWRFSRFKPNVVRPCSRFLYFGHRDICGVKRCKNMHHDVIVEIKRHSLDLQ